MKSSSERMPDAGGQGAGSAMEDLLFSGWVITTICQF